MKSDHNRYLSVSHINPTHSLHVETTTKHIQNKNKSQSTRTKIHHQTDRKINTTNPKHNINPFPTPILHHTIQTIKTALFIQYIGLYSFISHITYTILFFQSSIPTYFIYKKTYNNCSGIIFNSGYIIFT
eukprot:289168_1